MIGRLGFLPSLAAVISAGALIWKFGPDSSGWGWFLFVAIVLAGVQADGGTQ